MARVLVGLRALAGGLAVGVFTRWPSRAPKVIRGALLGRTIGGNGQSRDDGVALLLALLAWLLVAGGLYFLFRLSGLFVRQDKRLARSR